MAATWTCPYCHVVWSKKYLTCTCPGMQQHLRDVEEMWR